MSWSKRYRASLSRPSDTIDSIDTNPLSRGIEGGGRAVDGVVSIDSIVSLGKKGGKGHAPEPVAPPAELLAETWPDEGEAGTPRRYPGAVGGLLRASRCRPVSWADAAARPSPGSLCRNCEHSRWWGNASGWRCWTCHPPDGLALGTFEEVRT